MQVHYDHTARSTTAIRKGHERALSLIVEREDWALGEGVRGTKRNGVQDLARPDGDLLQATGRGRHGNDDHGSGGRIDRHGGSSSTNRAHVRTSAQRMCQQRHAQYKHE
jgi:hypothetical protein